MKKKKKNKQLDEIKLRAGLALSKFKPTEFKSIKEKQLHNRQFKKNLNKNILEEY